MPTVDFSACLSDYWFVWTLNGVGTLLALAINMAVSFFALKYFHNAANSISSAPKKPRSQFANFRTTSPVNDMSMGSWGYDPNIGYPFMSNV